MTYTVGDLVKGVRAELEAQKLEPITDEDRAFIKEMKDRMPHLSLYDDMRERLEKHGRLRKWINT